VIHGDAERAGVTSQLDNPMLQQKMKPRHLQMIAVGGSIGTGLFIGSGGALSRGGPLALIIGWVIHCTFLFRRCGSANCSTQVIMGFMLLMTIQAMGEMAIMVGCP
jgi:amino acid transporter